MYMYMYIIIYVHVHDTLCTYMYVLHTQLCTSHTVVYVHTRTLYVHVVRAKLISVVIYQCDGHQLESRPFDRCE